MASGGETQELEKDCNAAPNDSDDGEKPTGQLNEYDEACDVEVKHPEEEESAEVATITAPVRQTGCYNDDEDEADDELLQQACLPVSGAPIPPGDEPPQNADEYLRQVQWERLHCEGIVDVDVEVKPARKRNNRSRQRGGLLDYFERSNDKLPEDLQPCPEWAEDVSQVFRALRDRCLQLRSQSKNSEKSKRSGLLNMGYDAWRDRCKTLSPSTALLAPQDTVSLNHLVVVMVETWISHFDPESADNAGQTECAETNKTEVTALENQRVSQWVFAALAFVEEPLFDDIQYQLQRLRRACQRFIVKTHNETDGQEWLDVRNQAAVLMAIVTKVFGQM